jgi:hypothetical protein
MPWGCYEPSFFKDKLISSAWRRVAKGRKLHTEADGRNRLRKLGFGLGCAMVRPTRPAERPQWARAGPRWRHGRR